MGDGADDLLAHRYPEVFGDSHRRTWWGYAPISPRFDLNETRQLEVLDFKLRKKIGEQDASK